MKRFILYSTVIFCLFTLMQSCRKDNSSIQNSKTIKVTIKANEHYNYDLGTFGDEEGASINQQAIHYDVSFIERGLNTAKATYKYTPRLGYVGTDKVELKSERGSDGASPNDKIILTTIEFTISD